MVWRQPLCVCFESPRQHRIVRPNSIRCTLASGFLSGVFLQTCWSRVQNAGLLTVYGRTPVAIEQPVSISQSTSLCSCDQIPAVGHRPFESYPLTAAVRPPEDSRDAVVKTQPYWSCRNFGHATGIGVQPRHVNCNEAGGRPLHAAQADDSVPLCSSTNPHFWVHCTDIKVSPRVPLPAFQPSG